MYAKRKLLLGILSAVIFVCAAVLLILPLRTSVVRAQMTQDPGKYTSLAIKTQDISLEAGMQAEELKEHITVTAYYDGGSDVLSPDDYTLSLQEGGLLTAGQPNTLVATINRGTATGSVSLPEVSASLSMAIPTRIVLDGARAITSIYNEQAIKNVLSGTVYMSNSTGGMALSEAMSNNSNYKAEYEDLRPDSAEEAAGAYYRNAYIVYESGDITIESSNSVELQVSWREPTGINVEFEGTLVNAGMPLEESESVSITVTAVYLDMADGLRTLTRVLNPWEYTIVYQHAENAITFEDTGVKFIYTEGGKNFEIDYDFESHNVSIREASVITPSLNSVGTVEYDSETHTWSFANFSETSSVASAGVTPGEDNTATFSATRAGEYQVTFTAKSGYRYQYVPAGATPGYKEGEGPDDPTTTILSVTYTLTITKAEIVSADFVLRKDEWDYTTEID